ncbi:hypothetical protein D9758_004680 [Tetrapyrgos nigripes]|uniref:Cytochrome P450 n=1 Tax=Tetrapyrgos nigripes TaxID=182062 RepID=A0A8H5LYN0_9AGAR|nr:hypothetical protein D9758_004680 [Tetrapyrgos nigripes]
MPLPPGIKLLVEDVLPRALGPPLLVYGILKLTQYLLVAHWPSWVWVVAVVAAHPVHWIVSEVYSQIQRRREAAARGAVFPPRVQESSFQIVKALSDSALKGYMGQVNHAWSKQYGNVFLTRIFGGISSESPFLSILQASPESSMSIFQVMTTEPEHIKAILATQFDDFWKGPIVEDQSTSLLGSGVFNPDGDMWKFHRNMTRPFFRKVRISDFDVFERHAEDTLSLLAEHLASGVPVDFQDAIARFTLDSATEFLFGKAVNSLSAGLPYPASHPLSKNTSTTNFLNHPSTKFVTAFHEAQETKRRSIERVEEFVLPILDEAVEEKDKRKRDGREEVNSNLKEIGDETFLEHLVKFTEDKKVVVDELLNILLAARDTTAALLTFSVYVLTQRPDIYARLKEEITERVGNSRPTFEDTRDMKYLRAFLNEILRLYPPVPFDGRTSRVSTTLPNKGGHPWCIPKNTMCVYSVFLIHRREDLWGPDALDFDPDRFFDERLHKYLTPNPFIFLPFNAGPRICLGQQYAYNEASYFMIKLIQKFTDLSLALDVQPSQPPKEWIPQPGTTKGRDKVMLKTHLTMSVRDGLWVRMKPISSPVDQEKAT